MCALHFCACGFTRMCPFARSDEAFSRRRKQLTVLELSRVSGPARGPGPHRWSSAPLKPGLVPSCLFSWPTNRDTRDATPPPYSDPAGHLHCRTHPGHQPPDPLTRGLFAPRPSFKKGVLFGPHLVHSLLLGSCHQRH